MTSCENCYYAVIEGMFVLCDNPNKCPDQEGEK